MIDTVKKLLSRMSSQDGCEAVKFPSSAMLRAWAAGALRCQGCGVSYDLAGRRPFSMFNCATCGDLIFVPWQMDGVWAFQPMSVGGFGSIYHGLDTETGRHLAIKVIRDCKNVDDLVCDSFEHECRTAYSLGAHPNIAVTHSYGVTDTVAYMCMEYVRGRRLSEVVADSGGLSTQATLRCLRDIVEGLNHILNAGYLHRDVKPENVIITPQGSAVLVDYGSCMSVEQAAAIDGGPIFGSPHFCPPERYNGKPEDVRSDIYAVGHLAYFCLTGKPFAGEDSGIIDVKRTHTRRMRIPLAARLQRHDPQLVALIDSMVKWEMEERCGSYEVLYSQIVGLINACKAGPVVARGNTGRHQRPITGLFASRIRSLS